MAGRKKKLSFAFSYKKSIPILKSVMRKIPLVIWGGFAVFGIFVFGLFVAFAVEDVPKDDLTSKLSDNKSEQYLDVINSYQEISRLYYYQQQDIDIIADYNNWQDNPEELYDALSSYKQKKDEILFQLGRIYELRKKAGLSASEIQ